VPFLEGNVKDFLSSRSCGGLNFKSKKRVMEPYKNNESGGSVCLLQPFPLHTTSVYKTTYFKTKQKKVSEFEKKKKKKFQNLKTFSVTESAYRLSEENQFVSL
jgi:hypothetical protein